VSNIGEIYEQDIEWLLSKMPNATESEQDDFAERVAVMVIDGKLDQDRARMLAFKRLELKSGVMGKCFSLQ
jgi:hypothetical protein